jgi:muramoyltetrapeptide carboxypeptidase
MKRKSFIQSSIGVLTASYLPALPKISIGEDETLFVSPAFLKTGDVIGITAPAGYITSDEIKSAVQKMEGWGYKIKIGEPSINVILLLEEQMRKEQMTCSKCLMILK